MGPIPTPDTILNIVEYKQGKPLVYFVYIASMNIQNSFEVVFPTSLQITEQVVDVSFLNEKQRQFYINLLEEIIALYENNNNQRMIIGFAGVSGSGKSVVVELLSNLASQVNLPFAVTTVGIDAYSFTNDYLLTHEDDGVALKEYKGRYDTYDVEKLVRDLSAFSSGENISLPLYSRRIHDPVENVTVISTQQNLLLVEGLWLLYEENGWDEVRERLDYCYFIDSKKEDARDLTIKRHIQGGRSKEDATVYYDSVDATNYELVSETKEKADAIIPSFLSI